MLKVVAGILVLLVAVAALAQDGPSRVGIVTAVMEGDMIKMQLSSGPVIVRLANIDAPEPKQPGGLESRKALFERIVSEEVSLVDARSDGEDRLVAVIYLGDENINGWLVKQGHAWAYREFADNADYCVWENGARSLKRGLWAREEWLAPWEWRQGGRGKAIYYSDYRKASAASCIREMQ